MLPVNVFESWYELQGDATNRFQTEFSTAVVEQIFQIGPQKLHDQRVVFSPASSEMVDFWQANSPMTQSLY